MDREKFPQQEALGESDVFLDFQDRLSLAAKVDRSILLIGERGTGKELAARRLHYLSHRWQMPVVALNCAALPSSLIETELFGHEAGAYTGATKSRKGRFEEAHKGTLFLDEIGLIPMDVQEKILRVVEYGTFERVGSSTPHEVDVRIIAATNEDLPALCDQGKIKRDLLDRLSFEVLFLPPLRERGDDIVLLASFFANRMANELGIKDVIEFSEDVYSQLLSYPWPGNIRELKNVVERAVYRNGKGLIDSIQINPFENPYTRQTEQDSGSSKKNESLGLSLDSFQEARRELDIAFLNEALVLSSGNQKDAAKALGLTYDQFRGLYKKYKRHLTSSGSPDET